MERLVQVIKNNKKKSIYGLVLTLVLILTIFWLYIDADNYNIIGVNGAASEAIIELNNDDIAYQSILVADCIDTVSIAFSDATLTENDKIEVQIEGSDTGFVYYNDSIYTKDLGNDGQLNFELSEDVTSVNEEYLQLSINAVFPSENTIFLMGSIENNIEGDLLLNGELLSGDLGIKTFVKNEATSQLYTFKSIVILLSLITVAIVLWFTFAENKLNLATSTTLLFFSLGMVFLVIMTPLSPPDEDYHYHSAYHLSNYFLFQADTSELGNSADFDYHGLAYHNNVSSGYLRLFEEFFDEAKESAPITIPARRGMGYFVQCIPPAIGISIARILNLNFLLTFYVARLFNLLFATACIYITLCQTPRFKEMFSLIALFPMTLHQAASCSYDVFINSLSFILIALLLKAIWGKGKMSVKESVWILVCAVLLAPAKLIYAVIILLALFIPEERFGSKKQKYLQFGILAFSCLLIILLFRMSSIVGMSEPHTELNWEGMPNYSLSYLFEHPFDSIIIFLYTIKTFGKSWIESMIGLSFSGLTISIPECISIIFMILLFITAINEMPKQPNKIFRVTCLFIFGAVVAMAMLSMMLSHTSVTRRIILGVQGRYFIPVEPLLAIPFSVAIPAISEKTKKLLCNLITVIAVFLDLITITYILNFTLTH